MTDYALIFSGQGSERPGMFNRFKKEPALLEETIQLLREQLGLDVREMIDARDPKTVSQHNQILLYLYHYLTSRLAIDKMGQPPKLCMGHSFGQFSALTCAQAVSFVDMGRFIGQRSSIVDSPDIEVRATFKSIHGMTLDDFLRFHADEGLGTEVEFALRNQEKQIVVAATEAGAERLRVLASSYRYILRDLNIARPYHTFFMDEYNDLLLPFIERLPFADTNCPVLMNYSQQLVREARLFLEETKVQMIRPVYWYETVKSAEDMVDVFVVVDPSDTQLKIISRITDKKIYNAFG
jgi:[acyl-carrier-protein] S-malonyltransferase